MSRPKIRDIFDIKLNDLFDKTPQGKVGRAKTEDIVGHLTNDQLLIALDAWFQNVYNFVMEYHAFRNTGYNGSLDSLRKASRELRYSFRNPILYMVMLRQNMAKISKTTNTSMAGAMSNRNSGHKTKMRDAIQTYGFSEELWANEFNYKKPTLTTLIHKRRRLIRERRLREKKEAKKNK